ncbi:protein ALTERED PHOSPHATEARVATION RESPONSE 1-like isoform X2 [Populus alba x Populus x berolinensis]|nr:protein ALTERED PHOSPHATEARVATION RESPONSE 1-like isoform X2 [Populus alba x Populus x berolinensis]
MGASNSKTEEDKVLQLCRERKRFVRRALDGRCSLAAAHIMYIQSLRSTGTAIRKFVEPEVLFESSLYTSTNATPEPLALTKSISHFSVSSPSLSHPVDAAENLSPSPSPPSSSRIQAHHMKFRGFSSKKVEEKSPVVVTGTVTSSSTPQNTTPRSTEKHGTSQFEDSSVPPGIQQWDYFELFHPIDQQFSFQDGRQMNHGLDSADDLIRLGEEEGIPELEDEEEKASIHESAETEGSEDEFDDPPAETLVRSFENLNRVNDHVVPSASPTMPSAGSAASETELLNGEKGNSPGLSPLRTPLSAVAISADKKKTTMKEDQSANKVSPKDFFSSMKDIEYLFIKASESGNEVPRMLEANKLHFRPLAPGKENGSLASTVFKACFSCGEDPSQLQEEPAQKDQKFLTWHRTASSRSSSSRNPLGLNAKDDSDDQAGNLFDNFCMISGSHASTLDRLYAWERKLYDEVKASEMLRREYDMRCRTLRQLESSGKSLHNIKIDKTRAVVKDLHSRIRVALHRIDSISKRIEELRDKELQPQLEELIEGLSRMWEVMFECHKLQLNIITVAFNNGNAKFSIRSESHRQVINSWLFKCVFFTQKPTKRKRKQTPPSMALRSKGPPVYATCGAWLDGLTDLPVKEVSESIRLLAAETAHFLPRQEKNQGKKSKFSSWKGDNGSESAVNMLRDEASEDFILGFEHFRSSLEGFLGQLNNFAEKSVEMYAKLEEEIHVVKSNYEREMSQQQAA